MHWPLTFKVYSLSWKLEDNTAIFKDLTSKKLNTIGTALQREIWVFFTLKSSENYSFNNFKKQANSRIEHWQLIRFKFNWKVNKKKFNI
jgi:hypothetical protein